MPDDLPATKKNQCALLAGDGKSCWQLGEQAGHATPRRMQALLAGYAWDW